MAKIKVIASDMDGTLLNEKNEIGPDTLGAIEQALSKGMRFIFVTGRNEPTAHRVLKNHRIEADYIFSSGAQVRDSAYRIVSETPMRREKVEEIIRYARKYHVGIRVFADGRPYMIGTKEEVLDYLVGHMQHFGEKKSREEILNSSEFQKEFMEYHCVRDLPKGIEVLKIFIFSQDVEKIKELKKAFAHMEDVACASSFVSNVEITDKKAQKGEVLKEYIEGLGYSMEEVMVIGDSENDLSMLTMDYGMTVAMENAMPQVKEVCQYITGSNQEEGVAQVILQVLKNDMEPLKNHYSS